MVVSGKLDSQRAEKWRRQLVTVLVSHILLCVHSQVWFRLSENELSAFF